MFCPVAEGPQWPSSASAIRERSAPQDGWPALVPCPGRSRWREAIATWSSHRSPRTARTANQASEPPGWFASRLAPDGPAVIDGLDIAGQREVAADEAGRIAEGLGHNDGQILHREPPHRSSRSHELGHEMPDGGGREELSLGHQLHERHGPQGRDGEYQRP